MNRYELLIAVLPDGAYQPSGAQLLSRATVLHPEVARDFSPVIICRPARPDVLSIPLPRT